MPSQKHDSLIHWLGEQRRMSPAASSLAEDRVRMAAYASQVSAPVGVVETEVEELPGALLFTPPEPRDDVVLVQIHGGGFRLGSPGNERPLAGHLALASRARVLAPAYRLAPEHPYPAGLDDCERAYRYATALLPDAGVVIGGGSAGACLAASLLLRLRDGGDRRPVAGLLFCGIYDLDPARFERGSWVDNADTEVVLRPEDGPTMAAAYLGDLIATPHIASPLAADLAGLPPLFIQASTAEMLLDDSLRLAERAARAGVETTCEIWPHMIHGWQGVAGSMPEGAEALRRAAAFVDRVVDGCIVGGSALLGGPDPQLDFVTSADKEYE